MSTEDIILGVISLYPASGYDIRSEFERGGAGLLSALNFGSIYPRLRELEGEGLVTTAEADVGGRQRRRHELTRRGWEELAEWLAAPTDYPVPMRDELLLKMLFWGAGRPHDRATLIEHLQERRDRAIAFMAELEAWPKNGHSLVDEYGMLVLEYFQMRLEAELTWIERTIAQLEGPARPPAQDPYDLVSRQRERRSRAFASSPPPDEGSETAGTIASESGREPR
jgi:PadR family transcriptional regulator AphA